MTTPPFPLADDAPERARAWVDAVAWAAEERTLEASTHAEDAEAEWHRCCAQALRICDGDTMRLLAEVVAGYEAIVARLEAADWPRIEAAIFPALLHLDEPCRDLFLAAFATEHDLDPEQLFVRAYSAMVRAR